MEINPDLNKIRLRAHQVIGEAVGNLYGAVDTTFIEMYQMLEEGNKINAGLHERIKELEKQVSKSKDAPNKQ